MASIIAAAIVSPAGKVLVSRQFQDISRIQIEGLLSAFPKLLGTGSAAKEYTVVESGSYRYVFQPADGLYLVVLSTTQSNIVEDLAALRMLGRLLPDRCPSMDEATVGRCAFEILFAFDEVITNGQREIVSLEQVSAILEMFSSEEELQLQRKREQEQLATQIATDKAHELRKMKSEFGSGGHSSGAGFGGGGGVSGGDAGMGGGAPIRGGFSDVAADIGAASAASSSSKFGGGGGLSLSAKNRRADTLSKALKESGGAAPAASGGAAGAFGAEQQGQGQGQGGAAAGNASAMPVTLRIEEKISAQLNREGGVSSVDVSGVLFVSVDDAAAASVRVVLGPMSPAFTTKSHPMMNKDLFASDSILATKDNKPYPVGAAPQGVLRWRAQNPGGNALKVPITVNCWPSATGASIEFEHENTAVPLTNVRVALPLAGVTPKVSDCSCGEWHHDPSSGVLIWYIPEVNRSNDSGTLTVEIGCAPSETHFFPAQVAFDAPVSLAGVAVVAVQNVETGARVQYSCETILSAEEYVVS